jgi:hypothetical protein
MSRQIYSTIRATSLNDARARIEHFGTEIADRAKQDKLAKQEKAQEDAQQEDPDSSDNATDISVTPNETETPSTDPTETPSPDVTDPAS